ncbi:MAG: hypothetical protein HY810_10670 [Candidatus Omnitrophica bacterium]|nr:hypothetical protein [Candidatus Omnitrophota bacterium]
MKLIKRNVLIQVLALWFCIGSFFSFIPKESLAQIGQETQSYFCAQCGAHTNSYSDMLSHQQSHQGGGSASNAGVDNSLSDTMALMSMMSMFQSVFDSWGNSAPPNVPDFPSMPSVDINPAWKDAKTLYLSRQLPQIQSHLMLNTLLKEIEMNMLLLSKKMEKFTVAPCEGVSIEVLDKKLNFEENTQSVLIESDTAHIPVWDETSEPVAIKPPPDFTEEQIERIKWRQDHPIQLALAEFNNEKVAKVVATAVILTPGAEAGWKMAEGNYKEGLSMLAQDIAMNKLGSIQLEGKIFKNVGGELALKMQPGNISTYRVSPFEAIVSHKERLDEIGQYGRIWNIWTK